MTKKVIKYVYSTRLRLYVYQIQKIGTTLKTQGDTRLSSVCQNRRVARSRRSCNALSKLPSLPPESRRKKIRSSTFPTRSTRHRALQASKNRPREFYKNRVYRSENTCVCLDLIIRYDLDSFNKLSSLRSKVQLPPQLITLTYIYVPY